MMKVQRLLTGPMKLRITLDGEGIQIRFSGSSTAVNLRVLEWGRNEEGEMETLVHIWAPVLRDVDPSPALFEWVARNGGARCFGVVRVFDSKENPGKLILSMEHTLLGDYLDQGELSAAVMGVISSADKLDDELMPIYGGKRYEDA
jgi:hypothetical protein